METKLYHFELGIPANIITALVGKAFDKLTYSRHAQLSCLNDRYGKILYPPFSVALTKENIIEVEATDGKASKVLVRLPYNAQFDILVAFLPESKFVKTVWLNDRNDKHYTLVAAKYSKI